MKRLLYLLAAGFAALTMASCDKEDIGGTKTQDLAGQWYVQVDAAASDGTVKDEDPYGTGRFMILTYNTADDNTTEIFVDDLGHFWTFKVKVNCDLSSKTFSVENGTNLYYDSQVTIVDGKIVENGTTTPSGQPADYIEMLVLFSDDTNAPSVYDYLKFSGWRYTGFTNDD